MPNDVIPRARRRRLAALTAAGVLGAALVPAMMFMSSPAAAASPCVPAGYTAASTADLLKLNLLDVGPLGLLPGPVTNVTIGHANADMARAHPNVATARADYLSATLAGIKVPAALLNTHAEQTAPPTHAGPDQHSLLALHSGLLDLGVGNVSATAGKNGPFGCGIADSSASVLDAAVLPGAGKHSLLALPTNLNGFAGAGVISQHARLASTANAGAGLSDIELFSGTPAAIGVKVITEPALTAIAGGSVATSSLTYTSPVLHVTLPDGQHVTVDDAHASVDIATSASANSVTGLLGSLHVPVMPNPSARSLRKAHLEIRLSLGSLTSSITKTSVSGEAATLRLEVLLAPLGTRSGVLANLTTGGKTVLDLGIGELAVAATAPAGVTPVPTCADSGYGNGCTSPCGSGAGYGPDMCPSPSASASPSSSPSSSPSPSASPSPSGGATHSKSPKPSPSTTVAGTTTGSLPLTGSDTSLYLGGGVLLLVLGRFLIVVARRRMAS